MENLQNGTSKGKRREQRDAHLAARYSYDPYGNLISITNGAGTTVSQTSNSVAAINPFRYRPV